MNTIKRPARPVRPQELRDLIDMHNASQRAVNGALRGTVAQVGDFSESFARFQKEAFDWAGEIDAWYSTPEGIAYRASVRTWNEYVDSHNAAIKANRQARRNAREVSAVRSAACPRCFSTHAGEC